MSSISGTPLITIKRAIYPVGSYYINETDGTNPATLLGFGTWVACTAGQVVVAAGGAYIAGTPGGSATRTLTNNNLSNHGHSILARANTTMTAGGNNVATNTANDTSWTSGTTGSAVAINIEQPYLPAYIWRRTA